MRGLALLVPLVACGGGTADDEPDAGPGTGREQIGLVDVFEQRRLYDDGVYPPFEERWAYWSGHFRDRAPRFHQETMAIGACTMRAFTPAFCEEACFESACVPPGVCEPWPTEYYAGRLILTGLAVPVDQDPIGGTWYGPVEALPVELFADDATVELAMTGDGPIPALSLVAGGVPPIVPQIDSKITLVDGQDHTITWTPAGTGSIRVTINSTNSRHGTPLFAIIECETDDAAGQATIPAAMIEAFPPSDAHDICAGHDCPQSTIRRYRRATAPVGTDREVELQVASQYSFGVDHAAQ